jgi:DNA-binding transcriptional LysR family regulator
MGRKMNRVEQISRRLKLRHLNVLAAVAQWGSMAKAARHLSITQPVVSKAIAELEVMLGVRLLDRGPQGVEPTLYGRALLKRSVAIFDDLRTSVSEIEFLADPTAGELRIGTSEATGFGVVPVLIDRLARQYPRAIFEVVQAEPEALKERELRGRRIELAITRTARSDRDDDLDETILYSDRLCVVAGVNSPLAKRRKIALVDLVNEYWCLPPLGHPVTSHVSEAFRRCGLEPPQRRVTVTSSQFVSNLVAKGHFLGVHGTVYLRFNPASALLKVLPVELPVPLAPVSVLTLKNRTLSPVAQLFVERAREITKSLADRNG